MNPITDDRIPQYRRTLIVDCIKKILPLLRVQLTDDIEYSWSKNLGCQILYIKNPVKNWEIKCAFTNYGLSTIAAEELRKILDDEEFTQRVRMTADFNGQIEPFCRGRGKHKYMRHWYEQMLEPADFATCNVHYIPLRQDMSIQDWAKNFLEKYEWLSPWKSVDCLRKAFNDNFRGDSFKSWWFPKLDTSKAYMVSFDYEKMAVIPSYKDPDLNSWISFVVTEGSDLELIDDGNGFRETT
jgi:hypothetical protein